MGYRTGMFLNDYNDKIATPVNQNGFYLQPAFCFMALQYTHNNYVIALSLF